MPGYFRLPLCSAGRHDDLSPAFGCRGAGKGTPFHHPREHAAPGDGKAGIERLGVQDLSEAVKRFSGVTVQDYGGIGGLKTVSVRSLGAKHTAVCYDGVTVTDAQSGQVDISRFSLDNVDMISLSIGQADDIFQTARMYASAGALSIRQVGPYSLIVRTI